MEEKQKIFHRAAAIPGKHQRFRGGNGLSRRDPEPLYAALEQGRRRHRAVAPVWHCAHSGRGFHVW